MLDVTYLGPLGGPGAGGSLSLGLAFSYTKALRASWAPKARCGAAHYVRRPLDSLAGPRKGRLVRDGVGRYQSDRNCPDRRFVERSYHPTASLPGCLQLLPPAIFCGFGFAKNVRKRYLTTPLRPVGSGG